MNHRTGAVVAALVVVATLAPAGSSAQGAFLISSWDDCYRSCYNGFSVLGDTRSNRISLRIDTGREGFRLSTSAPLGLQLTEYPCERIAPGKWRCPHSITGDTTVEIDGSSGGDRIRVRDGIPNGSYLEGAGGRDKLIAADSDDHLSGENGNDVERGGEGDDRLGAWFESELDRGRDTFLGGAGDDVIRAGDYRRDRRIRCGSGEDTAYVDVDADPHPRGCEHIEYGL